MIPSQTPGGSDQTILAPGSGSDDNVSENCLPVGTRLAEFEITGVIGEGGFGIVYMTFDHSLRRPVAVKEYMPASIALRGQDGNVVVRARRHQPTFDTGLRSFINEARLLAQFDHSALIKVHRFWEQNKTAYMAMRYYEGSTLKEIVQRDPARVNEAWLKPMLQSILEALDTLYHENVLHRDISPDNILILESGEAVLLDFGSARQVISDMSQSLTVILKPGYAPIEQYADDSTMTQGAWTDIYSLAAVMYLAIVKRPPPTSVARMVTDTMTPLASGDYPGFSKSFLAAIDRGLAIRPEQRPQTIDAFRKLLQIGASTTTAAPGSAVPAVALTLRAKTRTGTEAGRAERSGTERRGSARGSNARSRPRNRGAEQATRLLTRSALAIIVIGLLIIALGSYAYVTRARAQRAAAALATSAANLPTGTNTALNAPSMQPSPTTAPTADQIITELPLAATAHGQQVNADQVDPANSDSSSGAGGTLSLNIKPWATITVDGVLRGVSPPLKKISLSEGQHRIVLANTNFPEFVTEMTVTKSRSTTIEHDFSHAGKADATAH